MTSALEGLRSDRDPAGGGGKRLQISSGGGRRNSFCRRASGCSASHPALLATHVIPLVGMQVAKVRGGPR